jgi:hypothetical protein
MNNNAIKVFFVQQIGDNEFETESLWCEMAGNNCYIVDNIPFVARRISLGDTIKALWDGEDGAYYFDDFVAVSGNTTLRLYLSEADHISPTREELEAFACESEVLMQRNLLAVNVPADTDYRPIKHYLDQGEKEGRWTYEESCLMHAYE